MTSPSQVHPIASSQDHKFTSPQPHVFTIRAHHLLCLQGFQGLGYSAEFVKNMQVIVDAIKAHPNTVQLTLTCELDDFCASCPHHGTVQCLKDATSDTRVKKMDQAVLNKLGVEPNITQPAEKLIKLSNQKFKTTEDAQEICGGCEWKDVCLWHGKLPRNT